jgi:hypothetical protein
MTVARSRGGPGLGCAALPGGEPLTSWHLASGAGCAMGTAVGPEAPLPNRPPLMAVASTSENRRETVDALPDKRRFPVLIQHRKRLRIGPNTDADASRVAHP